jgi:hypothetical protein
MANNGKLQLAQWRLFDRSPAAAYYLKMDVFAVDV